MSPAQFVIEGEHEDQEAEVEEEEVDVEEQELDDEATVGQISAHGMIADREE